MTHDAPWSGDVFVQCPQAAVVTDLPGRILDCNPLFEKLAGATRDQLVGERVARFWPDTRYDEYRAFREGILTGQVTHVEGPLQTLDGHTVTTTFSWQRLVDEDGEPYALLAMGRDITERRGIEHDLREQLELHRSLAEASGDHVLQVSLHPRWRVQFVNDVAARDLGVTGEESLDELVERFGNEQPRLRRLLAGEEAGRVVTSCVVDGQPHELAVRAVTLDATTGEPRYVVAVCRDLTQERNRAETLAHALELEREATDSLRRSDRVRRMFLTAVSHELRTPLTTAVGVAEVLRDRRHELPEETVDELVARLVGSTGRLQDLLDELIDVDRLLRGLVASTRRAVDLGALVHAVTSDIEGDRLRYELDLASEPVRAYVDPVQVGRALHSLLRNAEVHGGEGVRVRIRTRRLDERAVLSVSDDGPGIDPDARGQVVDAFAQGRSSESMASPGLGIGLTLVDAIVRGHGGSLAFDDGLDGRGVAVSMLLPLG